MAERVKVGVIGTGAISGAYLSMAPKLPILDIDALADIDPSKAEARAKEFGVPRVLGVEELLADPAIDVVLNLTIPAAHAPVGQAALAAGKHVFAEKPYGLNREEGRELLQAAQRSGLRTGCAPDTVLGAGIQTARKALDDGAIGRPVAFTATMMGRGPEGWHPNPEFYYQPGGGPMFDMGPYYLTALLNILGPVRRYVGGASIAVPDRIIGSEPFKGKRIDVQTPDHVCGLMEFENGCLGTIIMSFAVAHAENAAPIVIYGEEGTMHVPDPNGFDGVVKVRGLSDEAWTELPQAFHTGYGRAVGLADMCTAIAGSGRPHRCSGEQAYTVLDLMAGFLESSELGAWQSPEVAYERPAPMPADLPFGQLDA